MSISGFLRGTRRFFLGLWHGPKKVFDDGSVLKPLNREGMDYVHRDGRRMEIERYWPNEPSIDHQIYLNPWCPPHESESITGEEVQEIARKIEDYWTERGATCRVEIQELMGRQAGVALAKPALP